MRKIYLDNHTATRPLRPSVEAMFPFFRDHWGSLAAPHQMGQELFPHFTQFKDSLFESLGASAREDFYFFHSSGEAVHHLYLSHYFDDVRNTGRNHILTTNVEEASVLMALGRLEELGCHGKMLPVNEQGQLTKAVFEQAINPRTSLMSIAWANGLTGVIHPIADIAEVCKAKGIRLHVDASYVIGKLSFRFEDLPIDYLTFDGSLLHAPKGTAGLLAKAKTPSLAPFSSMSVGALGALSKALENDVRMFDHVCLETARLRGKFEKGIVDKIPDAKVLFQKADRLPSCSAIAFPGAASDALLFLLNRKGIYASLGGGHLQKLSHVLVASGIEESLAQCALSFSLSFETTEEEIDYAIEGIVESVQKLKAIGAAIFEEAT